MSGRGDRARQDSGKRSIGTCKPAELALPCLLLVFPLSLSLFLCLSSLHLVSATHRGRIQGSGAGKGDAVRNQAT